MIEGQSCGLLIGENPNHWRGFKLSQQPVLYNTHTWKNNMPLIAIPFGLILLFLIGTGLVKCGRWLKETIELGDKNDD